MSLDRSPESLYSPSKDNFVPFASSYRWSRSNTVRKVNSVGPSSPSCNREETGAIKRSSLDDTEVTTRRILDHLNVEHGGGEKLRKYLTDNTYRQSLESISEYKTKTSFISQRPSSSFESSSSDCTDYALRTVAGDANANNKSTILSESSSYLSWIESLNSEYLTNASMTDAVAADGKAGEWNNFWLNYNNASSRPLQQNSFSYSMSTDNTTDDFLDAKSASSVQKEIVENPGDLFYMTRSEILETIKCCQRIIEVLQTVLNKTNEMRTENSTRNNSMNYIIPQRSVSSPGSSVLIYVVHICFRLLHQIPTWNRLDSKSRIFKNKNTFPNQTYSPVEVA